MTVKYGIEIIRAREVMDRMCPESKVGVDITQVVEIKHCEITYNLEEGGRVTVSAVLECRVSNRNAFRELHAAVIDHKNCINFAGHGFGVLSIHDMDTNGITLKLESSAWV